MSGNAGEGGDHKSVSSPPALLKDRLEIAKREVANGLRQFDAVIDNINQAIDSEQRFRLRPSTLLQLNRIALDGLNIYAGNYRPANIYITGSKHKPPSVDEVPTLVEELCEYGSPSAAYVMWRINWIHPFDDGNGRTARAVSYVVLCVKLRNRLPGKPTIPDLIAEKKGPYYKALEAADGAWAAGSIDLTMLEALLESHLAAQLVNAVEEARGRPLD
jgi:fido (protein-threonine AMPylation protein)